jgi:predicted transcriptional regulator
MDALWRCEPATARQVHADVGEATGWAVTTVRTMLERLEAKGVVEARAAEGGERYVARLPREKARRNALQGLVERAFGGAVEELAHFLLGREQLDAKERKRLEPLLAREQERKAKP